MRQCGALPTVEVQAICYCVAEALTRDTAVTYRLAIFDFDGTLADSADWIFGIFNAVAFYLLTKAFHLIPVAYVNVVNASQTAMAALAGVLYFHEPSTNSLIAGITLMTAGLFLMDRPQRR